MGHIVLLGDSIFDNARYVPDKPCVVEQLRRRLPPDWRATLLAVDGHITEDVREQLTRLPADATHLVVSAGGNDALGEITILNEPAVTVGEALLILHQAQDRFRRSYRAMLEALAAAQKPTAVCTIYDAIPGLGSAEQAALSGFNALILREAFLAGLPVIDLRLVCDRASDFSDVSPIEPSFAGGSKISRVIADLIMTHDFAKGRSVIYT